MGAIETINPYGIVYDFYEQNSSGKHTASSGTSPVFQKITELNGPSSIGNCKFTEDIFSDRKLN